MPDSAPLDLRSAPSTLSDVLVNIESIPHPPTRRRDLRSALNRLAQLSHRPLESLPANTRALAKVFVEIDSNGSGLAAKTRRNISSNVLAALRTCGLAPPPLPPLADAWAELHGALPMRRLQHGLTRFMHFAALRGLPPETVADPAIDSFCDYIAASTLLTDKQIQDLRRNVPRLWNEAGETLPSWQLPALSVPEHRKPPSTPDFTCYPESFQAEVDHYCAWLAGKTFLEDPPPRILKCTTIRLRRMQIRLAGGALVRSGYRIEDIDSLAVLLRPENIRAIAEVYHRENDETVTSFLRDLVSALIAIARHWVRTDAATLDELKTLRRRLGTTPTTLTEKNRRLIHRFNDPSLRAELYVLPRRLLNQGQENGGTRGAIRAQIGLAIAVLTAVPLRVGNLSHLAVGSSLVRYGQTWRIHLAPGEVKNDQPLNFVLPDEPSHILTRYLKDFRRELPGPRGDLVFPGESGTRPKLEATLSGQISRAIAQQLGIPMTAHQFRHLAAKLYLDRNPGDYATLQRLLGHRNLKTTMTFYSELRSEQAGLAYGAMLEADRLKAAAHRRCKRRR